MATFGRLIFFKNQVNEPIWLAQEDDMDQPHASIIADTYPRRHDKTHLRRSSPTPTSNVVTRRTSKRYMVHFVCSFVMYVVVDEDRPLDIVKRRDHRTLDADEAWGPYFSTRAESVIDKGA
jgi:hypothetical protein